MVVVFSLLLLEEEEEVTCSELFLAEELYPHWITHAFPSSLAFPFSVAAHLTRPEKTLQQVAAPVPRLTGYQVSEATVEPFSQFLH